MTAALQAQLPGWGGDVAIDRAAGYPYHWAGAAGAYRVSADPIDDVGGDCESVARTFVPPRSGQARGLPGVVLPHFGFM